MQVNPAGQRTVIAGSGESGFGIDGVVGTASPLALSSCAFAYPIRQVYLAGDGSLYFAECTGTGTTDIVRIRRIDPITQLVTTVAGTSVYVGGSPADPRSGDGDSAIEAVLQQNDFAGFAVGLDGWMYLLINATRGTNQTNYLRRVTPDGIISTIAGGVAGSYAFRDQTPGLLATATPNYVALDVATDGTVIVAFADCQIIRFFSNGVSSETINIPCPTPPAAGFFGDLRIDPAGIVYQVTTNGSVISNLDSAQEALQSASVNAVGFPSIGAQLATLNAQAAANDDPAYILVGPASSITPSSPIPNGALALASSISAQSLALAPNGDLLFGNIDNLGQRVVRRGKPNLIASQDGQEMYTFDAGGHHLKTQSTITGAALYTFTYNSQGLVTAITDVDGLVTTIQRDPNGLATAIVSPYGQTTSLIIGSDGYLNSMQNSLGNMARMDYASGSVGGRDGMLTSYVDFNGNQRTYSFDSRGRLSTALDPLGALKTLTATAANGVGTLQTTFASPLGRLTSFTETSPSSEITDTILFPDSTSAQSTYDPISQYAVVSYNTLYTSTAYLAPDPRFGMQAPYPISATFTALDAFNASTTTRSVVAGNVNDPTTLQSMTEQTSTNSANPPFTTVTDAVHRIITKSTPLGRQTVVQYNAQGRPTSITPPGLLPTTLAYDGNGRIASATIGLSGCAPNGVTCRQTSFSYTPSGPNAGYFNHSTQANGTTLDLINDSRGNVLSETIDALQADQEQYGFAYDGNGNATKVVGAAKANTGLQYSGLDQLIGFAPPAVDSSGKTGAITFTYSPDMEPLGQIYQGPVNTLSVERTYDPVTGKITSLTYPGGQINYQYDYLGQLITINGPGTSSVYLKYSGIIYTGYSEISSNYGINTELNSQLLVSKEIMPSSGSDLYTINYNYDADNQLQTVQDVSINPTITYNRDPISGLLTSMVTPNTTEAMTYDGFGELSTVAAQSLLNSAIYNVSYTYDGLGRIVTRTENSIGTAPGSTIAKPLWMAEPTVTLAYSYTASSRIVSVSRNGVTTNYTYDADGNRTSEGEVYDAQDRLISKGSVTYSYDARGSLSQTVDSSVTPNVVTNYQYDALGNLLGVTSPTVNVSFVVDGLGQRISRTGSDGTWYYLFDTKGRVAARYNYNGSDYEAFVYRPGANSPDYAIKNLVVYRLINDERGSPRFVINTNDGSIVERIDYDEWGVITMDTNPGFQPFGFAGGIYDQDTKLTRFGARDYDASTGRWVSKDPILFGGGQSNLYVYAGDDPVNMIDPDGTATQAADAAAAALYNALVTTIQNGNNQTFKNILNQINQSNNATVATSSIDIKPGKVGVCKGSSSSQQINLSPQITANPNSIQNQAVLFHELYHTWQLSTGLIGPKNTLNETNPTKLQQAFQNAFGSQ